MKNRIIIIGAGPMGRQTYVYTRESCRDTPIVGFLDGRMGLFDGFAGYPPILGSVEEYTVQPGDLFVCALGDPVQRLRYAEMIQMKGGVFETVVHPTAYVGMNVTIGVGSLVAPHATVTCDVKIGNHVIVNVNSSISHDCVLNDGATVCPGVNIAGGCLLGERVFLGVGAKLIPHVSLGADVYVAAGAVVTKSFASGRIMGIPAKLG